MADTTALPAEVTDAIAEMQDAGAFGKVILNMDNGFIASVETRRIRKTQRTKVDAPAQR